MSKPITDAAEHERKSSNPYPGPDELLNALSVQLQCTRATAERAYVAFGPHKKKVAYQQVMIAIDEALAAVFHAKDEIE